MDYCVPKTLWVSVCNGCQLTYPGSSSVGCPILRILVVGARQRSRSNSMRSVYGHLGLLCFLSIMDQLAIANISKFTYIINCSSRSTAAVCHRRRVGIDSLLT